MNGSGKPLLGRKGAGRRKVPIEKILKKEACRVTFSKRRQGLFKKASEFAVLCGVDVTAVAFSQAGRPFTFSSSTTTPSLVERFISGYGQSSSSSSSSSAASEQQRSDLWWADVQIEDMDLANLELFHERLVELRRRVEEDSWVKSCLIQDDDMGDIMGVQFCVHIQLSYFGLAIWAPTN